MALVEYRDHVPQVSLSNSFCWSRMCNNMYVNIKESTFVTRTHDFTASVKDMKTWLDACSAEGGIISCSI